MFDQPGTTRDVVRTLTALDGWLVEFNDTAGIRESSDRLESLGIDRTQGVCNTAELVIWVRQPDSTAEPPPTTGEVLPVRNKSDLPQYRPQPGEISTSAVTGAGIQTLADAITARLVPREPASGEAILFTPRQISLCEAIEGALHQGREPLVADGLSLLANGGELHLAAGAAATPRDGVANPPGRDSRNR